MSHLLSILKQENNLILTELKRQTAAILLIEQKLQDQNYILDDIRRYLSNIDRNQKIERQVIK